MVWKKLSNVVRQHRYGLTLLAFLFAAVVSGVACVLFMRAFDLTLEFRLDYSRIGLWSLLASPLLFVLGTLIIRRLAPKAGGSDISLVVFAARNVKQENEKSILSLVDARTGLVKIIVLLMGLWAGTSTGREGPSVHLSTCVFVLILLGFRRAFKLNFDMRSAIVAGGAAGLAAAFNTPLAGVTFAIEELSHDYFSDIKDYVVMAIIFASLAAISLNGEYSYFGKLKDPIPIPLYSVLAIGVVCGLLGAAFSGAIVQGNAFLARLTSGSAWVARPAILSFLLIIIAFWGGLEVLGPGNRVVQELVGGIRRSDNFYFWFAKLAGTLVSFWSGVAGGIFAPCLAIGASLGAFIGQIGDLPIATCALIGMAAFLSGTVQAPLTSFVIIFEMTGHHGMLVPVMLASLISFIVARSLKAGHLYDTLSSQYKELLT